MKEGKLTRKQAESVLGKIRLTGNGAQQSKTVTRLVLDKPITSDNIALSQGKAENPSDLQVQVAVKAFSLNFSDLLCVKGMYPNMPSYPFTPGLEISGIVIETGKAVTEYQKGDEVIGLLNQMGSNASIVNIEQSMIFFKPAEISFEEASAMPVAFLTSWHILSQVQMKKNESILIHTATSGVGLMCLQLAKRWGAKIYVTAGTEEKVSYLNTQNIEYAINYTDEGMKEKLLEHVGQTGFDVIVNTLPVDYIQKGLDLLAPSGRYVEIAMVSIRKATDMDLSHLVDNQKIFSMDLMRYLKRHPDTLKNYMEMMNELICTGELKPTKSSIFSFSKLKEAYQYMENRKNIGKIVVSVEENYNKALLQNIQQICRTGSIRRKKAEKTVAEQSEDIAIVGMSGRFPGAENAEQFWENLKGGVCSIGDFPKERWDMNQLEGINISQRGGFLKNITMFEPKFFNMSGTEARVTDPQQRIFLEECWYAFEDAGYTVEDLSGIACGVYAGIGGSDYLETSKTEGLGEAQSLWGNESSILPARISYFLNLKGPSIAINTACSSSLVALHLAAQSILSGENKIAIAGGAFIANTPGFYISASRAEMLSKSGVCRTFDNHADGFVPGEGVGALLLKPLKDAIYEGDHIYGVIKGSGINQDGRTNGITAPSVLSQISLEEKVYREFSINPESISYVEAHGTGTKLGDPIEVEALNTSFGKFTDKKHFCKIGSVKTNVGHTIAAAGVTGVIKILLSMQHKQIPASLNFNVSNENIEFENSPFVVNKHLTSWEEDAAPRRAAISSFGFSGTNAHVVIEEAPVIGQREEAEEVFLIPISAKNENACIGYLEEYMEWVKNHEFMFQDFCYTCAVGKSQFEYRTYLVVSSKSSLLEELMKLKNMLINGEKKVANITEKNSNQDEMKERFDVLIKNEQKKEVLCKEIGELFIEGFTVDFKILYKQYPCACRKTSIPRYPFERQIYCLEKEKKEVVKQHSYFWKDHEVNGTFIVPAAGQIQWIIDQAESKMQKKVTEIQDIIWRKKAVNLNLELKLEDKECFRMVDSEGELISEGRLIFGREEKRKTLFQEQENYSKRMEGSEIYHILEKMGIRHSSCMRAITKLKAEKNKIRAEIVISKDVQSTSEKAVVLLDSAIQSMVGFHLLSEAHNSYIPFMLERLERFNIPDTDNYIAYVEKKSDVSFDIAITDVQGKMIYILHSLIVGANEKHSKKDAYLYRYQLVPEKSIGNQTLASEKPVVLINFPSDFDTENRYTLRFGKKYKKISEKIYEVNPLKTEDYEEFFRIIGNSSINILTYFNNPGSEKDFFYMCTLAKAAINLKTSSLSGFCQSQNIWAKALSGFLKSLEAEQPNIKCSMTVIDKLGSLKKAVEELTEDSGDAVYRDEIRYVTKLERMERNSRSFEYSQNGAVVITGGAGQIGRILWRYFYQKGVSAVMIGRSEKTVNLEKELKEYQGKIEYVKCDICNPGELKKVLNTIRMKSGSIQGVIHCAGVINDNFIKVKSLEKMREVISVKTNGIQLLDEFTKEDPLKIFVAFSSLAAYTGNVGQGDYAYANKFMDEFIKQRETNRSRYQKDCRNCSVNWPMWENGGMKINPSIQKVMIEKLHMLPISDEDGIDLFEQALAADENVVIATTERSERGKDMQQRESAGGSNSIRTSVKKIIAMETGFSEDMIEENENLSNYGLDSAINLSIVNRLGEIYGTLPKTLLFEYKTVKQIADYLQENASIQADYEIEDIDCSKKEMDAVQKVRYVDEKEEQDIAIIGISGMYPQAENLIQFWDNLKTGKNCIEEIPMERWDYRSYMEQEGAVGRVYAKWGGFIPKIAQFDPLFFKISPMDAEFMDPQERLFLECVWNTMEDAGKTRKALEQEKVGVFVGIMYNHYQLNGLEAYTKDRSIPAVNSSYASVANRVSYIMDFKGPSMAVDTMCSSSLTALHLACESIRHGESSMAIAGGVNLITHPYKYKLLCQGKFLSEDGYCRSFGEGGTGYVPAEGVGSVLLKPLEKAKLDGDNIYAVIKGSSVNHGGTTNGYTVPEPRAQAEVLRNTILKSNISQADISYVEAHGTGTALGDPIEIKGMEMVFGQNNGKKIPIGSVKSNIGHAESAAGMAALTKVLLQMKNKTIVKTLHSKESNSNIDFESSPFELPQESREWKVGDEQNRLAVISSFGAGGSNASILIEEWKDPNVYEEIDFKQQIVISAKTEEALRRRTADILKFIDGDNMVLEILGEVLDISTDSFGKDESVKELGLDYIKMTELSEQLNKKCGLSISATQINECQTVKDIVKLFGKEESNGRQSASLTLQNIAFTLNNGRERMKYAYAVTAGTIKELSVILEHKLKNQKMAEMIPEYVENKIVGNRRIISLPTYPFAEENYWVSDSEQENDKEAVPEIQKKLFMEESENTKELEHIKLFLKDSVNEILKVKKNQIQYDTDLGEYGFSSVTYTLLAEKIQKAYDIEVTPAIFYNENTIKGLSQYLYDNHREKIDGNQIIDPEESVRKKDQRIQFSDSKPEILNTTREKKQKNNVCEEDVAIVGISGAFPGAEDVEEYWSNLIENKDCIQEIPAERWDWKQETGQDSELNIRWGGFLKEIDEFDEKFFKITPFEADMMDPQQRKFLQHTWYAVEDAGIKMSSLSGTNTGVFVGAQFQDYQQLLAGQDILNAQMGVGNELSIIANRVSYVYNFNGPSVVVNTACSSSLVAVKEAVQSVKEGECDVALAGGVSFIINPASMASADKMGILSKTGSCKTLDEAADGYAKGEGIGVIVLKPISKALADKNHIYAVIKSSVVNHGGKASSLTAPNTKQQSKLLVDAYKKANIPPESVRYIELHGTGTQLGDPVEVDALKDAFKKLDQFYGAETNTDHFCGIGSVKTNIGHLEPASGIAGIIKAVLCLKYKMLPAILHLKQQNKYINLEKSPFYIVKENTQWKPVLVEGKAVPGHIGISSFGFGGVNAHVVLEEYIENEMEAEKEGYVFVLSAKSWENLNSYAQAMLSFFDARREEKDDISSFLADVEYTLTNGREEMEYRLSFQYCTMEEMCQKLQDFIVNKDEAEEIYTGVQTENSEWLELFGGMDYNMFEKFQEAERIGKILKYWSMGGAVDWKKLIITGKLTSLPKYTFSKNKHWIDIKTPIKKKSAPFHVMVQEQNTMDILPLNTKGGKNPSFWVHGAVGFGSLFMNLSKQLGADYPMYAFQAKGTNGKDIPRRLNDMVEAYIKAMKQIKPEGPYIIGGYSFGGLVAYEMAKRLSEAGEKVEKLIMFDTFPSTEEVIKRFYSDYDSRYFILTMGNELCKIRGDQKAFITYEDIQGILDIYMCEYVSKLVKERSKTPLPVTDIYNYIEGAKKVSDYSEEAYKEFSMTEYTGSDVIYFKAQKGYVADDNHQKTSGVNLMKGYDYVMPWKEQIRSEMKIIEVPSDHFNILEGESLGIVGEQLANAFEGENSLWKKTEETDKVTQKSEDYNSVLTETVNDQKEEKEKNVQREIRNIVLQLTQMSEQDLSDEANLQEYGIDSILISSIVETINQQFAVFVSVTDVIENCTIEKMAQLIAD